MYLYIHTYSVSTNFRLELIEPSAREIEVFLSSDAVSSLPSFEQYSLLKYNLRAINSWHAVCESIWSGKLSMWIFGCKRIFIRDFFPHSSLQFLPFRHTSSMVLNHYVFGTYCIETNNVNQFYFLKESA